MGSHSCCYIITQVLLFMGIDETLKFLDAFANIGLIHKIVNNKSKEIEYAIPWNSKTLQSKNLETINSFLKPNSLYVHQENQEGYRNIGERLLGIKFRN